MCITGLLKSFGYNFLPEPGMIAGKEFVPSEGAKLGAVLSFKCTVPNMQNKGIIFATPFHTMF